jgi:predicted PurR-regulated permease PerM
MKLIKTDSLKQIILLLLIVVIGITLIWQLAYFIPGALGAITLYILTRKMFYKLTLVRKWKKWIAALTLIGLSVVLFLIPLWVLIELLIPKFAYLFAHKGELVAQGQHVLSLIKTYIPQLKLSGENIQQFIQKAAMIVPFLLNASMAMLVNFLTALFLLYFMLMGGREMENQLSYFLPMNEKDKDQFWLETKNMVVSNAIGIPILVICQCIVAIIGYFIFGVQQPIIWGLLTGMASILPVVGTMVVWIPVCIILFVSGKIGLGIGLVLYCAIVVSNIDNVLRFTIMKKIGDVPPLITVFGVILGLQLFGLMGLIFGPLLIAYFLLLIKIYRLEFSSRETPLPADDRLTNGPGGT